MSDEQGTGEPVGSVGEEAAKLLQALQGWARDAAPDAADAAATAASAAKTASTAWDQVNQHIATGGEDCRYCPVCQAISAVRQTSPEVREHLAHAASSLMQAVAGFLDTQSPAPRPPRRDGPVQKIDLDDDGKDG